MKYFLIVFLSISFSGYYQCNAQSTTTNDALIKQLIAKKREYNKENGTGFRIQLYNGSEVKAKQIRAKFKLYNRNVKTFLKYQTPEWKIQVGHYKTKLDADRALLDFKNDFYSAIVVPIKN